MHDGAEVIFTIAVQYYLNGLNELRYSLSVDINPLDFLWRHLKIMVYCGQRRSLRVFVTEGNINTAPWIVERVRQSFTRRNQLRNTALSPLLEQVLSFFFWCQNIGFVYFKIFLCLFILYSSIWTSQLMLFCY